MFQFCSPQFRFGLFVTDNNKFYLHKNREQNNNLIVCYADAYDIKEDGSIVFYQTIKADKSSDERRIKIPVLSYPHGKWEACVLLDDKNDFPVFSGHFNSNVHLNKTKSIQENFSKYDDNNNEDVKQKLINDLNHIKHFNDTYTQNQQHQAIQQQYNKNIISSNTTDIHNPQEFKKQKDEWIENEIKQYVKNIDVFSVSEFLSKISEKPQSKIYKVTEGDIIWASSKLIRNKLIMSRKFSEPSIQKTLSLILPDIMKRQWDGKIAPILQTLQEREETKNVTAIDLAVWMVQNNYQ